MKAASAKAKGKRLEQKVAAAYRHYEIDETARPMPASGAFTHFPGDIWKKNDFEYLDECKNQEKVKLWEWWGQTTSQASGNRIPVLHVGGNFRPILTVLNLDDYMNLRKTVLDLEAKCDKLEQSLNERTNGQPVEVT